MPVTEKSETLIIQVTIQVMQAAAAGNWQTKVCGPEARSQHGHIIAASSSWCSLHVPWLDPINAQLTI